MFLWWGVVSTLPNPQAGGLPLIGCPRMLIRYIRSYPPYWRSFIHPQHEDTPCRGDRDPLITWEASYQYYKSWTVDFVKVTNTACFYFEEQILFQSMSNFTSKFLYLQSSLRDIIVIDSGSRLCDVWPLKCCSVARGNFLLQSIQTGSGNQPASFSEDAWGFFHWW